MAKTYIGTRRGDGGTDVRVSDGTVSRPLPWRLDLMNKSPTGLEWGYGGSGPGQLALAILADATGDDDLAVRLHQPFKWAWIAPLPRRAGWTIPEESVLQFVRTHSAAPGFDKFRDREDPNA